MQTLLLRGQLIAHRHETGHSTKSARRHVTVFKPARNRRRDRDVPILRRMQARNHGAVSAARRPTFRPPRDEDTIAIVGAGFCGTAVAIQLLRRAASAASPRQRCASCSSIRAPRSARASPTPRATIPYPLNVAAGQMSLDGASPRGLPRLRARSRASTPPPATIYRGRCTATIFARGSPKPRRGAGGRANARITAPASLQLRQRGQRWPLVGCGSTTASALRADDVVLALGNPPPACLPELAPLAASERYVRDPWSIGSGAHQEIGSVLLVGSGLTMIDAALRLAAIRPRVRHIHVLSRHGWLPEPQSSAPLAGDQTRRRRQRSHAARGSTRQLVSGIPRTRAQRGCGRRRLARSAGARARTASRAMARAR